MVETRSSKKTTQLGYKEDQNHRSFYSRFLFKALIFAVLCAVVPVFLSQTPELANQTRLLELLHLVFVGIAVSYGLFSRRNYDSGRGGGGGSSNNDHKTDHNLYSYVPKILEVSSVFNVDHESESEPSDDSSGDNRKFQAWRNKYQMKIPEVVLSKDHETRFVDRVSPGIREKPLLLPVRSLNYSRVSDAGENSSDTSGRWEKVRSKRQLLKSLADDNSDVLPSPIPWRSRSSSSSSKEVESQSSIKNLTTSSSFSASPRKSTSLPILASETEAKSHGEFHTSPSPPPPPPPPPLPVFNNSPSRKDHPSGIHRVESRESVQKKKFSGGEFHPPPPPPPLPVFNNSPLRKDHPSGIHRVESRESVQKKKFSGGEFHPPPPPPPPPPVDYYKTPPTKLRVSSERRKSSEQKMKIDDRSAKRNSTKKVWWSDPIAESKEDKIIRQDTEKNDRRSFLSNKEIEKSEDEEHRSRENENHDDDEKKIEEEEGLCESNNGSDVDKKADEFIAKFREQIRLQRIESIKRSTNKISTNSSR